MDRPNLPPCEMDIVIPTPMPPGSEEMVAVAADTSNSRRSDPVGGAVAGAGGTNGGQRSGAGDHRSHWSNSHKPPLSTATTKLPLVGNINTNSNTNYHQVKSVDDSDDIFVDCRTTSDGGTTTDLNGTAQNAASGDDDEERIKLNTTSRSLDEQEPHLGATRQYWRDIILGVNDGLVSTFLLVAGVAGGGLSSADILLTAIAGGIAGSVSMCAGEYVATKSQNEVLQGEITLEKHHIEHYREHELAELHDHLEIIGINPREQRELTERLVAFYRDDADALLKVMTALEFGVVDTEERSPLKAGLFSCILFAAGSLPSVFPFIFMEPLPGLIAAATGTTAALLCVGAIKTWATRGHWLAAAMENLCIAGFGGGFAYFVGAFFDKIVHTSADDPILFVP
ncbi:hypothetical protein ACA910_001798 [Epithemia clementina (nom. ined.)]